MINRLIDTLWKIFNPVRLVFGLAFTLTTSIIMLVLTHDSFVNEFTSEFNLGADNLYMIAMAGIVLGGFVLGMVHLNRLVRQKYLEALLTGLKIYAWIILACWLTSAVYTVTELYSSDQVKNMGGIFYYIFLTPFASGLALISAVILLLNWHVLVVYVGSTLLSKLCLDYYSRTHSDPRLA